MATAMMTAIAGTLVFATANLISYYVNSCPVRMDDCGLRFGFPFEFYVGGGFVGLDETNWWIVASDLVFAYLLSFYFVWFTRSLFAARRSFS